MTQTLENKLLKRIHGAGRGSVFTPTSFADLGLRASLDKALSRLVEAGEIRRLARGVYAYPEKHPKLGELTPSTETIVKAVAGRDRTRLQAAGAYAANLLGLSEQVPAKAVFLTDGASRTIKIGRTTIEVRRTTPRNMAAAGRLSGLVIQAFRHLGKEHVTPARMTILKKRLTPEQRRSLVRDLKLAPAWMHPLLRELAEG
ncbi:MAG: type IV toxin-antitoxin system AbiEi family antitoxin domain-containing protein [Pirellulales bacterium]|nr:type IV toxin-antitoxin system AbiEi family antitoxin domain-containing protein [Pirellulales bacterium]